MSSIKGHRYSKTHVKTRQEQMSNILTAVLVVGTILILTFAGFAIYRAVRSSAAQPAPVAGAEPEQQPQAMPEAGVVQPVTWDKNICVGIAYNPLRYKVGEGTDCGDGVEYGHVWNLQVADPSIINPALDEYCVGVAQDPLRYKVAKQPDCTDAEFAHQFSYKVPRLGMPGVNRPFCTGYAPNPNRYILDQPHSKCGESGWTLQNTFFTRFPTDAMP